MNPISYEEYQRKVQNLKTADDLVGFAREILAPVSEEILNKDQPEAEQISDQPKKLKGRRSWHSLQTQMNPSISMQIYSCTLLKRLLKSLKVLKLQQKARF